jgi:hypothetical protein
MAKVFTIDTKKVTVRSTQPVMMCDKQEWPSG